MATYPKDSDGMLKGARILLEFIGVLVLSQYPTEAIREPQLSHVLANANEGSKLPALADNLSICLLSTHPNNPSIAFSNCSSLAPDGMQIVAVVMIATTSRACLKSSLASSLFSFALYAQFPPDQCPYE